ncbi:MAG: DUF177 domain-containing protein [Prevotella sp.]|jgi:hypothetical protein|nr:DUF177 domain-containing protein [Prevotella sp.]
MSKLEQFNVDLKALSQGDNILSFVLDDAFFEAIEAPTVRRGRLQTTLTIHRTEDYFDLDFHTEGLVTVACDRCLDDLEQPISADDHLVAKFGTAYSEDDELVIVAENEGMLDVSWFIYQFVELSIPLRHVHAPGKCNPAMMKALEEHSAARSGVESVESSVDSRWAVLEKLKNTELKD